MQKREKKPIDKEIEKREKLPVLFHLELDRLVSDMSVSLMGVLSIIDLCDSSVILKMRRGKVRVRGEGLSVSVYENKTVEIIGKVFSVEFI
jgi:hypothetical protein